MEFFRQWHFFWKQSNLYLPGYWAIYHFFDCLSRKRLHRYYLSPDWCYATFNPLMPKCLYSQQRWTQRRLQGLRFIEAISDYKMTIWNRWGAHIWDRRCNSLVGTAPHEQYRTRLPQGVYVYQIEYLAPRVKPKTGGHCTLVGDNIKNSTLLYFLINYSIFRHFDIKYGTYIFYTRR